MGIIRNLLGPDKDEVWQEVATEISAEYIRGGIKDGWWAGESKLNCRYKDWTILIDTYEDVLQRPPQKYTRVRSVYFTTDDFYFSIHHRTFFSLLADLVEIKRITVEDSDFSSEFSVKGNNEEEVKRLLSFSRIRYLIKELSELELKVRDDDGLVGIELPTGACELYLRMPGYVKDKQKLRQLVELFEETLDRLVEIGSAEEKGYALSK